ncbi:hypothetical protein CF15_04530 [Pyrodictium occultum]|uniref:Uncharacterized protein n=1 Tax=Pyrodictium occultum TaxID=2309 RepID=A0A0V8RVQ1_PYROC|nr:hypothetical protein [Pyrodictium occultum]KSW12050.1 hypothetical protein CF15_04530 [Pyrodictium occultum]
MTAGKRAIAELREALQRLLKDFQEAGRRGKLLLTLVAALKLREKEKPITPASVAEEARRIIEETRGEISWGVESAQYTAALAADLLQELVEMGVLEPGPEILRELGRRYRFRSYGEGDAEAEARRILAPVLMKMA